MKIIVYEYGKGYASYTYKIANMLAELGNTVTYVSSADNPYVSMLGKNVINKSVLKSPNPKLNRNLKWFFDRAFVAIGNTLMRNKLIRECKPDIVNIHSTYPMLDTILFHKRKKTKYIMTVHNVIPHEKSFIDKGYSIFLKRQDALIVHTKKNVDELKSIYGIDDGVVMIPHGVDSRYQYLSMEESKKKLGIDVDKKVLLFFGAVKAYKGLDVLLEALRGSDFFLLIAGHADGNFEKYQNMIKKYSIDCKCMIDFVAEEEIPVVFQAADVVVLPYIEFHSQSGVLMQIAKYRRPVVATDVGDFRTFIEKYNIGLVCEPKSVENLKITIESIFSDEKRMKIYSEGCELAVKDNSWERCAQLYEEAFYDQID